MRCVRCFLEQRDLVIAVVHDEHVWVLEHAHRVALTQITVDDNFHALVRLR